MHQVLAPAPPILPGVRATRTSCWVTADGTAIWPDHTHPGWWVPWTSTVSARCIEPAWPVCTRLRKLSLNVVRGPPVPGVT